MRVSDEAKIDLAHAGAVAELKAGDGGELASTALVKIAFANTGEFQFADAGDFLDSGEGAEARGNLFVEHGVEFARWAGEEENGTGGAAVDAGRKVESGSGAIGIWQDVCTHGHVCLAEVGRSHGVSTDGKKFLKRTERVLVLVELESEGFGDDFAGEIVAGWAEAAGDDQGVGSIHHFLESLSDGIAVRDGGLAGDAQTHGKELSAEPAAVGIEGVTEEQLGAGVEDFDSHWGEDGAREGRREGGICFAEVPHSLIPYRPERYSQRYDCSEATV